VGCGRAGWQLSGQLEPDDLGDQHRDRLAEHGGLGLDAPYAPAEHAEAVLHGGVRVGADAGVGVGHQAVDDHHDPGQVLYVHLVPDAGPWRHRPELAQRLLAPAQEGEPLGVALELKLYIPVKGVWPTVDIGDDGVVDYELGRDQRVDPLGVAA